MTRPLPPGPDCGPLGLAQVRRMRRDTLQFFTDLGHNHGPVAYARIGPVRLYLVRDPETIRTLLVTKAKSFRKVPRQLKTLSTVDGQGLVISEGDFWARQRRLVQPTLAQQRMAHYAEVMVGKTHRQLDGWTGREINMADEMTHLTLAIICKAMFGIDLDLALAESLREAVATLNEVVFHEFGAPLMLPDWLPTAAKLRKRRAMRVLDKLIWGVIRERAEAPRHRDDLISRLLSAVDREGDGSGMTQRQARDEAMTMLLAGHDTTAATLAWAWQEIARHGEIQTRLHQEVDEVLGQRPARHEDLARLVYTQSVVKETMRLYPATFVLFAREALEPVELGGYPIPRGAWVYASPWITQRHESNFPDPLRFDPQRFAPEEVAARPPFAWFPFGGGPHACIGSTFALTEMTLIVASVLQRFRIDLAPGQGPAEPELHLSVRPLGGLRMVPQHREFHAPVGA